MSKRIKIGLIGCGMISGSHVNGYLAHPQHAEIVAVCDTVDANAKRRHAEVLSGAESHVQNPQPLTQKRQKPQKHANN